MLSYQHGFHAGNAADVHKHSVLCGLLSYLTRKDKPLTYVETHAGRGLYDLDAAEARRTGESEQGVGRFRKNFSSENPYLNCLTQTEKKYGPSFYPGSPMLALLSLRSQDHIHLAEMHPREFKALEVNFSVPRVNLYHQDGWHLVDSVIPPAPRRGLIFIDPSYEIKTEYKEIPVKLGLVHRKWNVGVIVLWYPILSDGLHLKMLNSLQKQFPKGFRHEVNITSRRQRHQVQGSGLFIINSPYGVQTIGREVTQAMLMP
jgi:23S rRNA (adenine2030-N6)-methyltransferase